MKLLVCDIEGTIFKPHMIKDAQHASYIWTAIAARLGKEAEVEEIETQKKWKRKQYGDNDGEAYVKWVIDTIKIHKKHKLSEAMFNKLIEEAPYVEGVEEFFKLLNRNEYTPIFISGGIQNLSEKACRDLGVDEENSYAACKYYFNARGQIDENLTFLNTSNFYGKQELVSIALKRYGLSEKDWIFIGDGINDVSVAQCAPLSIGINPVDKLVIEVDYSFDNFLQLIQSIELVRDTKLFDLTSDKSNTQNMKHLSFGADESIKKVIQHAKDVSVERVEKQVGCLNLSTLEERAWRRMIHLFNEKEVKGFKKKATGIEPLLEAGELSFLLHAEIAREHKIASAILQPFSNATEIMIYVCLAITEEKTAKEKLLSLSNAHRSLSEIVNDLENEDLKAVLRGYLHNRNIAAHSYQAIPIDAARSFIQRTYESIQRLELIINPINIFNIPKKLDDK